MIVVAMSDITKEWTIELATAKVERGSDRIERLYGWEIERVLTGMRALLAVGGSTVGLVIAAIFGEAGRVGPWQIVVAVAALGVSLGALVYLHAKLGRLYGNYLESLHLFAVLQRGEESRPWMPSRLR
jgi:hypothetical protein